MFDRPGWVARARIVAYACIVFACGLAPSCSLIFDGSRFRGGMEPGVDAAIEDAGVEDAGPPVPCETSSDCSAGQYCEDRRCVPCDGDRDGYLVDRPGCDAMAGRVDCNDTNPSIHPGALPVCGNGVDESCVGSEAPYEVGFFPVREVAIDDPGSAGAPAHGSLRVFSMLRSDGPHAEVTFQTADAQRRVPRWASVPLTTMSAGPVESTPVAATGGMYGVPEGFVWYDAQRLPASSGSGAPSSIRVAMLVEGTPTEGSAAREFRVLYTDLGPAGPGMLTDSRGGGGLSLERKVVASPALVHRDMQSFLGVPLAVLASSGATGAYEIRTLGVDSAHNDVAQAVGSEVTVDWTWGSASSGQDAVFQGAGAEVLLWNGSLDSSSTAELRTYNPKIAFLGRVAIATLGITDAGTRPFVLFGSLLGSWLRAASVICPVTTPLAGCMESSTIATSDLMLGEPFGESIDPLLAATQLTSDRALVLMRRPEAPDGEVGGLVYEGGGAGFLDFSPLFPAPGTGSLEDLDVDALPTGTTGAMGEEILVTYAYVRASRIHVGGAKFCAMR